MPDTCSHAGVPFKCQNTKAQIKKSRKRYQGLRAACNQHPGQGSLSAAAVPRVTGGVSMWRHRRRPDSFIMNGRNIITLDWKSAKMCRSVGGNTRFVVDNDKPPFMNYEALTYPFVCPLELHAISYMTLGLPGRCSCSPAEQEQNPHKGSYLSA